MILNGCFSHNFRRPFIFVFLKKLIQLGYQFHEPRRISLERYRFTQLLHFLPDSLLHPHPSRRCIVEVR